ncbi:hypothetical protein ACIPEP_00820, partial [Curtobacterium sp. NPDC087082]|uniref:hypothetical protein n=1 Tax=Curtobacterium sp. NPDC087082 TaxID=3363966 RepID=UPI00380FF2E3
MPQISQIPNGDGEFGGEFANRRLTAAGSFPADRTQRAQITGTAEAGATVVFKMGMVEAGRVTADATDGSYTWDVPAPMQGGTKSYTVSQIVDGTESGNVQVDLNYGTAVSISSPEDGAPANAGTTQITGRGENGSAVTVGVNGTNLAPVTVTNGTWTAQADLRRGENTITATQASKGANSTTTSITVNPGESNTRPFEVTSPSNNDTVDGPTVEFEGKAEPGTTVRIREGATEVMRQVTTGTNENWSGTSGTLSDGLHRLTVEYTEPGQTTPQTQPLNITVSTGVVQDFNWATPDGTTPLDETFSVTGSATTGTVVNIVWHTSSGTKVVMDNLPPVDASGEWSGIGTLPVGSWGVTLQYKEPGKAKQTIDRTLEVRAGVIRDFNWATPDGSAALPRTFAVTGTATTGTEVNIIHPTAGRPAVVMNSVYADDQGNWSGIGTMSAGERDVILQFKEPGSRDKQTITRTLRVSDGQVVPFEWTTPDGSAPLGDTFAVSGRATTGTEVNIIHPTAGRPAVVMNSVYADDQGN